MYISIKGVTINKYYAEVITGLDITKYVPIAIIEGNGKWDEKCSYSLSEDGSKIHIRCIDETRVIGSAVSDLVIICYIK